jgi:hypothetical protein
MRIAWIVVASMCSCARGEPVPQTVAKQPVTRPVPRRAPASDPPSAMGRGPDAAAPVDALLLTVGGNALALKSALALDEGRGSAAIYLTNFPYTCKELLSRFRPSYPDELELKLRVGSYLHRDGKRGWAIRGTYSDGASLEREDGGDPLPVEVKVDARENARSTLPLNLTFDASGKQIVVRGSIEVAGCGSLPNEKPEPELPPQKDAAIVLAGERLPIVGAGLSVKRDGSRELELATSAVTCVSGADWTTSRSDVRVRMSWTKTGQLYAVAIGGYWVDSFVSQSELGVTATPNRPASGAKQLVVELGGAMTINGYSLALSGAVHATVCPTPRR